MTTWTPTERELAGGTISLRALRSVFALTLVFAGLTLLAFDGLLVARSAAVLWEQSTLFAVAIASVALGGALVLGRKHGEASSGADGSPGASGPASDNR